MQSYIQHDEAGNIVAVVNSNVPLGGVQAEAHIAAGISPSSHYVADGAVTAYTAEQRQVKAARPAHADAWDNTAMAWVPKQDAAQQAVVDAEAGALRRRRQLLADTDWLALRAAEGGGQMARAWVVYRQALRDITDQPGYPLAIEWPTPPSQGG